MTLEEEYARVKAPTTLVVRFGSMKMVAEYPSDSGVRPGCGSKLVALTHRGTEITEMLTTTCSNSGCGKSVSRQEMMRYIEQSGGEEFPFHTNGRVLRLATSEDMAIWSQAQSLASTRRLEVAELAGSLQLAMRIVEVEPVLGGESVTVHYTSEERVDFREMVQVLASRFGARIEMHQVGARDEARIVADYERCGQHCCCKNFLKVLKPVSMKSAKVQKATLDPLKISGRCGRLMCCLRYEDETYEELSARLPRRKAHVGTPLGPGIVQDSKILVQLSLVRLDADGRDVAIPVEELTEVDGSPLITKRNSG